MTFNVSVFSGSAYNVEKRNVERDTLLSVPEGTILLHSEVVIDDMDGEQLEVWLAIPTESLLAEATSASPKMPQRVTRPTVLDEAVEPEVEDDVEIDWGIDEEELTLDEDDEYYV